MRTALISIALASCTTALSQCSIAPAARSPLREALATADEEQVEQAVTSCLTSSGWKVDPLPGTMADAQVFTSVKGGVRSEVYVHGSQMTPRITGGPDDGDSFWSCLPGELRHPVSPAPSASAP
jgi:hypothetical protein